MVNLPFLKVNHELHEVWGAATQESLDRQGEIVDFEASKKAFAELADTVGGVTGGKSLGPVREMHQPKAIGRLISVIPDEVNKRIWVGAKLSDSADGRDAWQKVQEGVLTGFSIGAPSCKREIKFNKAGEPEHHVVDFALSEVSLVDLPACYESTFAEVKLTKGAFAEIDADAPRGEDIDKFNESHEPAGSPEGGQFAPGEGGGGSAGGPSSDKPSESKPSETKPNADGKDELRALHHSRRAIRFNNASRRALQEATRRLRAGDTEGAARQQAIADENETKYKQEERLVMQYGGWRKSADEEYDDGVMFRTVNSEDNMSELEKAGKRIGASPKPGQHTPPGAQAPITPSLKPMEAPPTPAKSADNPSTGKPAGPHEEAATTISPPDMQGKAAEAPGATVTESYEEAATEHEAAGEAPPVANPPMPPAPIHAGCPKCGYVKEAAAGSDELQKAFSTGIEGLQKAVFAKLDAMASGQAELSKRLETLENTPMPGGPARTELPAGVAAVEKSGVGELRAAEMEQQLLIKAAAFVMDPLAKDAMLRQAATLDMKKILRGEKL
jgi:HK97 family phage prohead protease